MARAVCSISKADGSGTANFEGGLVNVNADGSGTINAIGEGGSGGSLIDVQSDGGGTYNGPAGLISLDGKGAGTWNSERAGLSTIAAMAAAPERPRGLVTINADGSGTWNGPDGLVQNHGDGTGTVGTPPRECACRHYRKCRQQAASRRCSSHRPAHPAVT